MPSTTTVWHWTQGDSGAVSSWCAVYARARLDQADGFAADIIELADAVDEVAHATATAAVKALPADATETEKRRAYFYSKKRSIEGAKLAIDVRKWAAARMHPSKWGDKVTLEHTTPVDNPFRIDFSNISTAQLERIAELEAQLTLNTGSDDV